LTQNHNFAKRQPLFVHKLILTNFKNYAFQEFELSQAINCFTGNNGMGKTNILDAIYYLCMSKSYFLASDKNIVRHGEDFFRLVGEFDVDEKQEKIVAKVIPGKRKELERNDKPYQKLSEHIGLLPVVIVTPDDTSIATEGSEVRRRFLDNTLSQLNKRYLEELILYNKVLRQRNAALKSFAENGSYQRDLIKVYDQQLLAPATFIFEQRNTFLKHFIPILKAVHLEISGDTEQVGCVYRSQLNEMSLELLLDQNSEKDRILQRTTCGIHRDDLVFTLAGNPLKRFASQGQLKTFTLALKIAQYQMLKFEKKKPPLLLLDDIFDKLDAQRVKFLLQLLIRQDFGQIFITDTHPDRVTQIIEKTGADFRKFHISHGTASPV
jgi:DNA replication and repair protein RecF